MKKLFGFLMLAVIVIMCSCSGNTFAAINNEREANTARLQSEYARTVNKLEMKEGNFETYRRVVFYNVRQHEIIFTCEGYCHVQIDNDGDVEIVIKTGGDEYLRHYLGQKQDITYFSEQLKPNTNIDNYKYKITFNPNLWLPEFGSL